MAPATGTTPSGVWVQGRTGTLPRKSRRETGGDGRTLGSGLKWTLLGTVPHLKLLCLWVTAAFSPKESPHPHPGLTRPLADCQLGPAPCRQVCLVGRRHCRGPCGVKLKLTPAETHLCLAAGAPGGRGSSWHALGIPPSLGRGTPAQAPRTQPSHLGSVLYFLPAFGSRARITAEPLTLFCPLVDYGKSWRFPNN
jgi:hypothetical protein